MVFHNCGKLLSENTIKIMNSGDYPQPFPHFPPIWRVDYVNHSRKSRLIIEVFSVKTAQLNRKCDMFFFDEIAFVKVCDRS